MNVQILVEEILEEKIKTLQANKKRLEEQITQATGKEIELPGEFEDQRRLKLSETIKQLNLLNDEKLIISVSYATDDTEL